VKIIANLQAWDLYGNTITTQENKIIVNRINIQTWWLWKDLCVQWSDFVDELKTIGTPLSYFPGSYSWMINHVGKAPSDIWHVIVYVNNYGKWDWCTVGRRILRSD
jgi:hypothetical protein